MKYRALGSSGFSVSEIGMGCAALGGGVYQKNDREAIATLNEALDCGITFFDTANTYSAGHSERLIGRAFKGRRDKVIIATKAGTLYPPAVRLAIQFKHILLPVRSLLYPIIPNLNQIKYSGRRGEFSPQYIAKELHSSLKRLDTDYIDLYQLHNPLPEALNREDLCEQLEKFKQQGKIRAYGIACKETSHAPAALRHPIASVQVVFNLLDQEARFQCLPSAAERSIGVIARLPFAQGLLTDTRGTTKAEQIAMDRSRIAARKAKAQQFRFLGTPQRTLAQAALQFVLQTGGVSVTIPGMSSRKHLQENLKALEAPPLSAQEMERAIALAEGIHWQKRQNLLK